MNRSIKQYGCLLMALCGLFLARAGYAQIAYAVDGSNNLLRFSISQPGVIQSTKPITGLGGDFITDLDIRPANGGLYALAGGRLFTIDTATGAATQVGSGAAFSPEGGGIGMDFNPTVDRLRIVAESDMNLRLHPDTAVVVAVDGTLAYAAGDPNAAFNANVSSAAYTNNFAGATLTSLYGIDAIRDVLVLQNPPNAGTLTTVGGLGVNAGVVVGFDIVTLGGTDAAYALMEVGGQYRLYRIALATGAATLVGAIGNGALQVRGLAVSNEPDAFTFENPQPGSFQSGIGVMSGWACTGPNVSVSVDGGAMISVPYGSSRLDTSGVCGASNTNTGFGLLINFNLFGAGAHSAQLYVNNVAVGAPVTFTVVVPSGQFLTGVNKSVTVTDFPTAGRTATLQWSEAQQNFVIRSVQ
jgi:hypothetical protein